MHAATKIRSNKDFKAIQPADQVAGKVTRLSVKEPQMVKKEPSAAPLQIFDSLWSDVHKVILSHSNVALFSLGRTSKYWNTTVNEYLKNDKQGRAIWRDQSERMFRRERGISVTNQCRQMQSTSFQKFSDFDDSYLGKECLTQLKTSSEPVCLMAPSKGAWISADLKLALASRNHRLTLIEFDTLDRESMESAIEAIQAIPNTGFLALSISSTIFSSANVSELWATVAAQPQVVHIECNGDDALATGAQIAEWITLLSKENANISSFTFNGCRLDELNPDVLFSLLAETAGIKELEITELQTCPENAKNLFEVVRSRNASADSKLTLYFAAGNLEDFIEARERLNLASDSIVIRTPGQLWAFQDQPVEDVFTRENPIHENSAHEDSSHDDSSSMVGDTSSGDDAWGSEFEYSADESDVIVTTSSDDESGVENPQ